MIGYPPVSLTFSHTGKESKRSGYVSIEAPVPSLQEGLEVTTGNWLDSGQVSFRVGDIEAVQA